MFGLRSPFYTGGAPRTLSLCYFLILFIKVRWAAVVVGFSLISVAWIWGVELPYPALYASVAAVAIYNFFLSRYTKCDVDFVFATNRFEPSLPGSRRNAMAQIVLDVTALFALLSFSGGLENPFVLFFLFHVVIAGMLLEPFRALLATVYVSILLFALGVCEAGGFIEYHPFGLLGPHMNPLNNPWFVFGLPALLSFTAFVLSGFTVIIMTEKSRQRDQVIVLTDDLERKNAKLLKLDEMRRNLLAIASHDLKSPLAAVSSYLMTVKAGYAGEVTGKQKEILERCLGRLEGLQQFVSDVLSWTSIERGELLQDIRPTDAGEVLVRVGEFYAERAEGKNIRLELNVESDLPLIEASKERLAQVFENLLSNAVKYTLENGRVSVTLSKKEDFLVLEVADTGIGMSEEDKARLFEDFFRSPKVKKEFEGTGLGMSVVRRIVMLHSGEISVESALGEGTVFRVKLPIRQPQGDHKEDSIFPPSEFYL